MQNRSIPPATIIPVMNYSDVPRTVAWLCRVFGFTERLRIGTHRVQLRLGDGYIVAADMAADAPSPSHDHSLLVRVADVDQHHQHSRACGAEILNPPTSYPFGERQYSARDIGGHRWTFSQTIADVDPAQWGGEMVSDDGR